ncbi:MAG: hypothetical protein KAJ63_08990 [Methyloprofundus sp.]|nr:hypothetical protein [Methyloprofundus sp.]
MTKKLIALIFYFCIHSAFAQSVPPLINYQGMLTDSEGNPAVGTKRLTFNIYASAGATDPIWGPQIFTTVPLINGQFNVILGTTDTTGRSLVTAFDGSNRYLGIAVDNGAEMTPRQQVLSAPYAIEAENANLVQNIDVVAQLNAIKGMIAAFNLEQCPNGWVEYKPAYGRVIRGIDKSGDNTIDPDGQRSAGETQEDAFQGHIFGNGTNRLKWSGRTDVSPTNGYATMQSTGFYGENPAYGTVNESQIVPFAGYGIPRVATETRSKNVALLYCFKE